MRLDQSTLQSIYPAPSAEFTRRMAQLPQTLKPKEAAPVKRFLPRAVAIAALLALALSTTAYALTRPAVLQWLLSLSPASLQLEQTTQEITASATAEGITVCITGAAYDGSELAISYAAENAAPDQPVIIALDSQITLDGQLHTLPHPEYTNDIRMVPSPHLDVLPVQRNPITGGFWSGKLPKSLHGMVDCTVTFIVYRPEKAFSVLIDPEDALLDTTITDAVFLAEIADARATLESFRNARLVVADESAAEHWSNESYTPVYDWGTPIFNVQDAMCNVVEVARITVPFTIDADKAISHDLSGAQAEFENFTVYAESFRLTPLRTYVDVRLLPQDNSESAAHTLSEQCGAYTLTDDLGQHVIFSDMDYCDSLLPYVTCMDGQWVCRYLIDMPGLLTFPDSIGFSVQTGELLRLPLQ